MSIHIQQSPLPGTFYLRPAPDAPVFKAVGDAVKTGEIVGLIEVMKQFIEVEAEVDGIMLAFSVEDGASIEPGQTLFTITMS